MSRPTQPVVGSELAGYLIEDFVGRGGMGEVFRAHDPRLGRDVALKVLAPHLAGSERFRERFLRESMLAARLDHPNVIPIFEAGESDGNLFIAMRLVEGTDLRAVLREERVLAPERSLGLLAPVAAALDAAHTAGLVHRDVKPANILIARTPNADPPEHVYLSDFGLTTLAAESTETGPFTGTADYAAPELVTGRVVDHRVDVYALGCVLFEALTGSPPYSGDSVMAVLWGHVNDPVPDASERNPSLPGAVDRVLRRALAKEPGARYSSCRALVADLREALGLGASGERSLRRPVAVAALAVLVAAGATAAALLLGGRSGSSPPTTGRGALVRIDAKTGRAGDPVAVGADPVAVAATPSTVWVASRADGALWRYTDGSGISTRIPSVGVPGDLALSGATLYVAAEGPTAFSGNVAAYDATSGQRLGGRELLACSLAAGREGVWVAGCPNVQQLTDTTPFRILHTIPIPFQSPLHVGNARQELADMTLGGGFVYALGDAADRRLWRIDPRTAKIDQVYELDFVPVHVVAGPGGIWVTDQVRDAVVRLDLDGRVVARIHVPAGASGVALGGGSLWVASYLDRSVTEIDPKANRVIRSIRVRESPRDLTFSNGAAWVVGDAS
jgi:serine/threonine-protein kinase